MSTVAEQLRSARKAKNLTVQQVAEATKIRTDHIDALERGDFSVFSAPIYIRGSVKNYATTLKLDLPVIMATLEAECARLVALGAVRVRLLTADDDNESCIVMQDIEGNEFCLD